MTQAGPSVTYRPYRSEECDLKDIMDLVDQELSEPYVVNIFDLDLPVFPDALVSDHGIQQTRDATLPQTPNNGVHVHENVGLPVVREDGEVAEEHDRRVDEILEKVESGMAI
ncbi:hypothetical protein QFC19_004247 [Naganishia cerealis]|uniref:Uncharacterized protein n=1 Tax=Naganishia cerealis TaxID=610337 RepID=A0ACC2VWH8_9TREE|nr:hypothetical protein QFC19_004247 [Naganishia cerealis]